jgi:hypothetical protein
MSAENLLSGNGLLTILFTEVVAMVVFHGTPVGGMLMSALGLEHAAHIA